MSTVKSYLEQENFLLAKMTLEPKANHIFMQEDIFIFLKLHHRYFECNYGTPEMPWDKWFSTYHNGTEEDTRSARARKKRMSSG